ncbi:MAG: hypothetical protein DRP89_03405 [Candidatus Neomarinimicrobiota bacterium]|nr:MAG: hypothetical protein DRP89_03405 [Candidatus Neomarinimicrobiota bacterium]
MVRASRIGEKLKEREIVATYIDITESKRMEIIQKLLYQIATSVHATKSMGELSRIIQLELGKILDTTNFFIALYNKEEDTISLPYFLDEKDHFETFPAGKTFTAYVIKSGKPLLAKKEQIKQLIQSGEVEVVGTISKVWLGVPLIVEEKIIGVIVVQSYTDENAFNEKDLELLKFLSSQIGLSIEHKLSDEKVQESEENYHLLVESVNDGIVISQKDKFIFFNKRFADMLGYTYDELFMKAYSEVYTEKGIEILMERKRRRERGEYVPSRYETVFKKKDGTTIDVEANVTIIDYKGDKATFAVIRDITDHKWAEEEKKAMQVQLMQSQKLESIGTLASGVAHEINNPLTGIINYAQLIHNRVQDDSLKEFAGGIIEEGDRVAKIVRNLLSFSRQGKESHSPANIKDIIDATLSIIGSVLRKDQITLEEDIPEDLPQIRCRKQQIEQVIMNLLTNSRDALNHRYPDYDDDKILKITVLPIKMEGKRWIRTTVEDHGSGIPQDIIDRIFDPFFTTKTRDRGTGLGLSVSYGIIREHGGEFTVDSELGKYTRFHVDLPINN